MADIRRFVLLLVLGFLCLSTAHGQSTIPASGGDATGSGGSETYTVGQANYNTYSGTNGSAAQGVQQPYEISLVTAVENTEGIILEYKVYPNPVSASLTLTINPFSYEKMRYCLLDLNGATLQDKKIEGGETIIPTANLTPAVYLLKIINNNQVIKVFKVIKN